MDMQCSAPRGAQLIVDEQARGACEPATAAVAVCGYVQTIVANGFGVDPCEMAAPTRGQAPVAFARQVAMYLAHVACGLKLTDVGRYFDRDRTTVAHACERVEDRRDVPATDLALDYLEGALSTWLTASGIWAPQDEERLIMGRGD